MSNESELKNVAKAVALEAMIHNRNLRASRMGTYDLSISKVDHNGEAIIRIEMEASPFYSYPYYMAGKISDIVSSRSSVVTTDAYISRNATKARHHKCLMSVIQCFNQIAAKITDRGKEIIEVLDHNLNFDDDGKSCLIEIKCRLFAVLNCPVPKKEYDNKQRFINCAKMIVYELLGKGIVLAEETYSCLDRTVFKNTGDIESIFDTYSFHEFKGFDEDAIELLIGGISKYKNERVLLCKRSAIMLEQYEVSLKTVTNTFDQIIDELINPGVVVSIIDYKVSTVPHNGQYRINVKIKMDEKDDAKEDKTFY